MNESFMESEMKSNAITGMIGAIVGALIGSVLWVILYQIGIIAAIAGYAIAFCAYKGYVMLGKAKDKKAAVIALIVSIIVITVVHFLCYSYDVYTALSQEYEVTFLDAVKVVPQVIMDSENILGFIRDLAIGYVLMIVGSRSNFSKKNEEEETVEISEN